MWVSTRCRAAARCAVSPASRPDMWTPGGLRGLSCQDASHRNRSLPAASLSRFSELPVSPGVGDGLAVGGDAERVGLDRVRDPVHDDGERPDGPPAGREVAEVVDLAQRVLGPVLERAAQPLLRVLRAVDRQRRQRRVRVVAPGVGVGDQVEAVVAVQVTEQDRVDPEQADAGLQRAEGAVADVDQQPEAVGLEQVGRAGARAVRGTSRSSRGW